MELSSGVPNWTRGMPDQSAAKKNKTPKGDADAFRGELIFVGVVISVVNAAAAASVTLCRSLLRFGTGIQYQGYLGLQLHFAFNLCGFSLFWETDQGVNWLYQICLCLW